MNKDLTDLLSKIPGITHTREGLRFQLIELADRPKLLTLPKDKRALRIGQWVRVLKGQYKGDIALVCRTSAWGTDVLLVPRLSSDLYDTPSKDAKGKGRAKANDMDQNMDADMDADTDKDTDTDTDANMDVGTEKDHRDQEVGKSNATDKGEGMRKGKGRDDDPKDADGGDVKGQRKRKRNASVRNTPKLFRPEELQNPAAVQCGPNGHQFLGRLEFTNGLLFKWFDYSALSVSVFEMPWSISKLFAVALRDNNPIYLTQRPRPQEWVFSEGEKVIVCSSKKRGVIQRVERGYVEVEYDSEGTGAINWYDLQKDIEVGHFVTILNGPSQGYEGWVLELYEDEATIMNNVPDMNNTNKQEVSKVKQGICLNIDSL